MQSQNRVLDDLARVASGALGVAAGLREEVEARLREQSERVLADLRRPYRIRPSACLGSPKTCSGGG